MGSGSDGPPRLLHTTKARNAINLDVSQDGRRAVINDEDERPSVFDTESGRAIARLEGQRTFGGPAAFLADGSHLLAPASDYEMGIFDGSTGKLLRKLRPFRSTPRIAATSADSRVAAVGTAAGEIRVFMVETGRPLLVAERPSPSVFSFERDGTRLIVGSQERFDVLDLASTTFGPPLTFALVPGSEVSVQRSWRGRIGPWSAAVTCRSGTWLPADPSEPSRLFRSSAPDCR